MFAKATAWLRRLPPEKRIDALEQRVGAIDDLLLGISEELSDLRYRIIRLQTRDAARAKKPLSEEDRLLAEFYGGKGARIIAEEDHAKP